EVDADDLQGVEHGLIVYLFRRLREHLDLTPFPDQWQRERPLRRATAGRPYPFFPLVRFFGSSSSPRRFASACINRTRRRMLSPTMGFLPTCFSCFIASRSLVFSERSVHSRMTAAICSSVSAGSGAWSRGTGGSVAHAGSSPCSRAFSTATSRR